MCRGLCGNCSTDRLLCTIHNHGYSRVCSWPLNTIRVTRSMPDLHCKSEHLTTMHSTSNMHQLQVYSIATSKLGMDIA